MTQYELKHTQQLEQQLEPHYQIRTFTQPIGKQFKSCQAWELLVDVIDNNTGEIYENCKVLQSYNTLVAIIINGTLIRGKFSPTTSKQITQWANQYAYNNVVKF